MQNLASNPTIITNIKDFETHFLQHPSKFKIFTSKPERNAVYVLYKKKPDCLPWITAYSIRLDRRTPTVKC